MDLAELAASSKPITLRAVRERESAIISYRIILTALLREIRAEVTASVLPEYREYRRWARDMALDRVRPSETWFDRLRIVAAAAIGRALAKARRLFERESESYTKRFLRSVLAGTGVALPRGDLIIPLDERQRLLEAAAQLNATLIKSLSDDALYRVEVAVLESRRNRASARRLSAMLQKEFGTLKWRADLIAVDQIASLHSDFTQMHHEAVGITSYAWTVQGGAGGDGRVRPLHLALHGRVYKWGEPTGAENGLPPGKPIRCRCVSRPVVAAST